MEGGTDPTQAQVEGVAALGMDVAQLRGKVVRLQESFQKTRVLTVGVPVLREAIQSLEGNMEDLKERMARTSHGEDFEQIEEMMDVENLKEKARKLMDLQHGLQASVDNLPVLRDAIASLESRVGRSLTSCPDAI